jgi:hypothetical protein
MPSSRSQVPIDCVRETSPPFVSVELNYPACRTKPCSRIAMTSCGIENLLAAIC